jgi:hypothetical protein
MLLCTAGCVGNNCLKQFNSLIPAPTNWAVLQPGTYLISTNAAYVLVYQSDGDIVVGVGGNKDFFNCDFLVINYLINY